MSSDNTYNVLACNVLLLKVGFTYYRAFLYFITLLFCKTASRQVLNCVSPMSSVNGKREVKIATCKKSVNLSCFPAITLGY